MVIGKITTDRDASRGHSAIAELLVQNIVGLQMAFYPEHLGAYA